jgi:acetyl-CoA carboxylase carboxyltransferase component
MEELRRREALAEQLGGPERVKRQHDGGRLTIRERIDRLVDAGSFHELGKIAGKASYDRHNNLAAFTPSNFVFGRARVDGRPVVVGGDDFTVRGGSADATIKDKHLLCEQMANELRLPLIRLVEGSGGGGSVKTIETTGRANVPGVSGWEWVVNNIATVPRIALGLRSVAGLGAAHLAAAHYSVMIKELSALFVAGPPVSGSARSSPRTSSVAGRSSSRPGPWTTPSTPRPMPSHARAGSSRTCRPRSTSCRRADRRAMIPRAAPTG